jgi:Arc/MetJ-type ribon-helix-helix transcriptional regulator
MREPRDVPVTVTLSAEQAAAVRRVVAAGAAESVSAYVSEALRGRLARDGALATLGALYARRGVTLRAEHHAWARRALGVAPPLAGDRVAGPAGT